MPKTKCKICESNTVKLFKKEILGKYQVDYFQCPNCEFIQTEEPYWLDEAYKEPINISDTGLLSRNIYLSKISSLLIFFHFNKTGTFLDFAAGYGVFTRLMRDIGFNFLWHDIFTTNLFAKCFEWVPSKSSKIEMLTTFECFEHLTNPTEELKKMLKISDNLMFSTQLIPTIEKINNWEYLGISHGQHISFYSKKTLTLLANKNGLILYTNNKNIHLFTKERKKINIKLIQIFSILKFDLFIKYIMKSKTVEDSEFAKEVKKHAENKN